MYGETGKMVRDFYFYQGKLFFIFEQNFIYNRPIGWDEEMAKENNDTEWFDEHKTVVEEARFYIKNDCLIRWLDKDKNEINLSEKSNKKQGEELIQYAYLKKQLIQTTK